MSTEISEICRNSCHPLEPVPTGVVPTHRPVAELRAVLFDLYGTLLVSASGAKSTLDARALSEVWTELTGAALASEVAGRAIEIFDDLIDQDHAGSRARGIEYGEVDIRDVWRGVLSSLAVESLLTESVAVDAGELALRYELRVNPVWPMPGARDCLEALRAQGKILGIISNAQFYSLELFESLVGATCDELGLDPGLRYCSFEHGEGKPSPVMHLYAANDLARAGIGRHHVLYVGNDMLNDVATAARVGFRTALFAGDARSLRMRAEDPRVVGIEADLVLESLADLPPLVDEPPA